MTESPTKLKFSKLLACHACDQLFRLPPASTLATEKNKARCPRCGHLVCSPSPDQLGRELSLMITASILFILALSFPFLSLTTVAGGNEISLFRAIAELYQFHQGALATAVLTFTIITPAVVLVVTIVTLSDIKRQHYTPRLQPLAKIIHQIKEWSMAEVFLIGNIVALVKIVSLAHLTIESGFYFYLIFAFLFTAAIRGIDKYQLWQTIAELKQSNVSNDISFDFNQASGVAVAKSNGLLSCHTCLHLSPSNANSCSVCNSKLHSRKPDSLQRTLALVITAMALYVPANIFPMMVTHTIQSSSADTIIGGVILFASNGDYLLALVIFCFSVALPLAKILALFWLCLCASNYRYSRPVNNTKMYKLAEMLGKWSMVDVFVVAILTGLVQIDGIVTIQPGLAGTAFAAMVIVTMIAAASFDTRLIWDQDTNAKLT